jgi:acetoin utilization protein AcuB
MAVAACGGEEKTMAPIRKRVIREYMTPNPIVIDPRETFARAHQLMREHRIRHLPVVASGEIEGLVSERDLLTIERFRDVNPEQILVEEAMAPCPYRVSPETPFAEVARTMMEERYGSALIVEGDRLVGLFTTTDALRAAIHLNDEDGRLPGGV